MRGSNVVESPRDRVVLAQDAGYSRVSFVSALSGTLVAYGAFLVLAAIFAAVVEAAGWDTDLTRSDWERLGTGGGLAIAGALFLSYLFGGYVAGRMARRAGALNGFAVFVLGVLVVAGAAALVQALADTGEITDRLRDAGLPTTSEEWRDLGSVAGIASLVAMLVAPILGGLMGERWHNKLLARALDPEVGPEHEIRDRADVQMARADRYREDTTDRVRVSTGARERVVDDDGRSGPMMMGRTGGYRDDDVFVDRDDDGRDDRTETRRRRGFFRRG